jgi:hypothetical protein
MSVLRFSKVIFFLFLLSACGGGNPLKVDVSSITVPAVKVKRFDHDLFGILQGDLNANTKKMLSAYDGFYEGYLNNLNICRGTKDSVYAREIAHFVNDPSNRELVSECNKVFPDINDIESGLEGAFRHYRFYFPNRKLPVPVAGFTSLNYNMSVYDSLIAFSLEMYLGRDSKLYDMAQVPMFKRITMNRENIVPDFVKGWMMNEYPFNSNKDDLMSEMIYQGKIVYMIDALLPDADDTLKIGFTRKQLEWCKRNEANMWGFLLKNQLLFSTTAMDISQFVNEAPFTRGFVKDSPGRTGVWLGWNIVKSYMKKNPKTSLQQLMEMNDAQALLNASGYKP